MAPQLSRSGILTVLPPRFFQLGDERGLARAQQLDGDGPVLLGNEGADLLLPLHDQLQGDGLHAPGRKRPADLALQHRADLVAGQAVQQAAHLLGIDLVGVDGHGLLHGLQDGGAGDLVEQHAQDVRVFDLEDLLQVKGDGLAFAVGVRGQQDSRGVPGLLAQFLDQGGLAGQVLVMGLVVVLDVDPQDGRRQVADMPHRRADHEVVAEVLGDRVRLGRRFDDNQRFFSHDVSFGSRPHPRRSDSSGPAP